MLRGRLRLLLDRRQQILNRRQIALKLRQAVDEHDRQLQVTLVDHLIQFLRWEFFLIVEVMDLRICDNPTEPGIQLQNLIKLARAAPCGR